MITIEQRDFEGRERAAGVGEESGKTETGADTNQGQGGVKSATGSSDPNSHAGGAGGIPTDRSAFSKEVERIF